MKLEKLLSPVATVAVVAASVGLAFNAFALALFAAAAGILVVLVGATDYSRRTTYARADVPVQRRAALPLAA